MNNCKTCKHWQKRNEYETGHSQGLVNALDDYSETLDV